MRNHLDNALMNVPGKELYCRREFVAKLIAMMKEGRIQMYFSFEDFEMNSVEY